jgi:hypothetical protein
MPYRHMGAEEEWHHAIIIDVSKNFSEFIFNY